jgi:hypothetical protein
LLKQPADPADRGHETLASEAAFYQFCQQEPAAFLTRDIMPFMVHHDAERSLLAIRMLPEAETLTSYVAQAEEPRDLIEVALALGGALGTIHRIFRRGELANDGRLSWLSRDVPWVMSLHRATPQTLARLSPANTQLIRMLQRPGGCAPQLDAVCGDWLAETVIHGDIRADNVLLGRDRGKRAREVRVVDWEMVQLGDPAWDLAGALQAFARMWVDSMPMTGDLSIDERIGRAGRPLGFIQDLSRSLWKGYRTLADEAELAESERLLERAVKLSAVRMIQTAYEYSFELTELHPRSVMMLQMGENVLARPELARMELFGISLQVATT